MMLLAPTPDALTIPMVGSAQLSIRTLTMWSQASSTANPYAEIPLSGQGARSLCRLHVGSVGDSHTNAAGTAAAMLNVLGGTEWAGGRVADQLKDLNTARTLRDSRGI